MKVSKSSLGPSVRKIGARIQKVRKAAHRAERSKHRLADYRYLRSVLSAYRYFENNKLLAHLVEIAPSILMTAVRVDAHPVRVIIDASCIQSDLRMRSRWTRALQYALSEDIDPQELSRFLQAHNGISGCADLASKTAGKRLAHCAIQQMRGISATRS
jgi:hypothetical protein